MLDLLVRSGSLIDGTGAPARPADLGVRDGRIVAIARAGGVDEPAARVIDADGLAVTPGFIDIHTHIDAQVLWDPACTPLPQHGITTAIGGNCGFSIAPVDASGADYLMRMLAAVEEIPLASLTAGVGWDWSTTAEYLARVRAARPAINVGFMVGHSTLRRLALGEEAVGRAATPNEVAAMAAMLKVSLSAGGLGFSSSWQSVHLDGAGDPVPSRWADADEVVALCAAVRSHVGTHVEFIPGLDAEPFFDDRRIELLSAMSTASQRTVNWNVFIPSAANAAAVRSQLDASDAVARAGGRLVALSYPCVMSVRRTLLASFRYGQLPGWADVMVLPPREKTAVFADPDERARLGTLARTPGPDGAVSPFARWEDLVVAEGFSDETRRFEGSRIGDVAAAEGRDPFEVLCDLVVRDEMRTGFTPPAAASDAESWALRVDSWTDPRVVLGASDAGAHLATLATFDWATEFLRQNRARGVLAVEDAVRLVTAVPAALYGLHDRGRIVEGAAADLLVLDPDTIGPNPARWRDDLPGGAGRLYGTAAGLVHVVVNGEEIVRDGELLDARPGRVLRSGTDTRSVGVAS